MTENFADPRTRSTEKNFVISWLRQTNEGESRKSLDDSFVRIYSHDYIQNSLKRKKKPAASFDSFITEESVRTSLKQDTENFEKNKFTEKSNNESYLAKSIPKRYDSTQNEDNNPSAPFPETVFQKRMRYKTREDRYEIDKKKKIKHKPAAKTSKKSRRNRRKSNKGLCEKPLPSFSSRKIGTDRLTLKATNYRGIFKNGRASSPIMRRGIPDLSFSEMEFLQHSSKLSPRYNGYLTRKKGRLKAKCRNLENDEVSTFFKPSTVSLRVNDNQYHSRSSDRLSRETENINVNPGLPIIDKKKPFLNRRASIGSFSNLPNQSSSARSSGSIKNCSNSIAKSNFSFSETQNSPHKQVSKLIRDIHNDNHLMGTYTSSRSVTPTFIKSKDIYKYKKHSGVGLSEDSEGISVINTSLNDQKSHPNLRMTNIGHLCSDAKNNLNFTMNLEEEKKETRNENYMKHAGTMTTSNLDQRLNIEQRRENYLSQDNLFSTKTYESKEISNVLKSQAKSVYIKRPSTAIPILSASQKKNIPVEEIHNTKIGSLLFHKVYTKENMSNNLSNSLTVNCCTPKKEQSHDISTNNDDQLSLFGVSEQNLDKISICQPLKNQVEENLSTKKNSMERCCNKIAPKSLINFQSEYFDNIYYHSIASPNLTAEAVSSPTVKLVKEHQEENFQFLSQLQHYQNSNEHIPNFIVNSSPISMDYTYPSLLVEDTQFIGTKHSFYDACDQYDDQSEFINQTIYYDYDFANLNELNNRKIEYKNDGNESFQNETIIGSSQLDNCEAYKKSPTITDRTPYMTSSYQESEYLLDKNRLVEEQNDMEGFWDIHRGY
ncbi:hypothetical protein OnM2_034026 [Erysiphe neolycopersici]|uniref:Uncharacterized protein n=1 Tax=Erysiphe neolycopersici TaxID=212602 RepID=A0A420HY05_9PEZI|nr:hypothetical protein OnM2_034026 [Erysiphe neolycopersici]